MAPPTNLKIFSLHGKGLKLNTRADIEAHLKDVDPSILEEVHFGGNTIGVDASLALAEFLQKATALKVRILFFLEDTHLIEAWIRWQTSQTSSLVV